MKDLEMDSDIASHKTGSLSGVTLDEIKKVLGNPNVSDDFYKVRWSWGFRLRKIPCAIWDWKGSADVLEWSIFGPKEVWQELFPNAKVS